MKHKTYLQKGDVVKFISGNFEGLTGEIITVDWNSSHTNAIYGFYHEVFLSDGRVGFIEKTEHWEYLKCDCGNKKRFKKHVELMYSDGSDEPNMSNQLYKGSYYECLKCGETI